jgi:hypothetical protein
LTLTVTLSRVMTSWGGMSMVTVRSDTFTIRSTMGMMKNRPGPLAPMTRPRRKITPRSYSLTIRTLADNSRKTTAAAMATPINRSVLTMVPP